MKYYNMEWNPVPEYIRLKEIRFVAYDTCLHQLLSCNIKNMDGRDTNCMVSVLGMRGWSAFDVLQIATPRVRQHNELIEWPISNFTLTFFVTKTEVKPQLGFERVIDLCVNH